ncbi:NAD(P)H-dependent oxidoreductase [Altererythrobacter sp.]|uniref:flavodoxin family protein n=1 Tax=Altererythrobacter sp. TaxID=1872480 RepID=UPI001B0087E8|nr:NAD(P)H-dependent oxidoreductase [Altererythrobacter sp.]MBO6609181.1 NAD(P)H-dependent oxidoreductase [Altererythrobacter sp.]MBO6641292.1 NAD(P)H-dependent oxidoreductase [Altererythrobacter sp.]MBO6708010.1 NAD(P)H-dependent oxidoreductase [Altererythrobacter sp.]
MTEKSLLIVWQSRTGASEALAESAAQGAEGICKLRRAQDVQPEDILLASGYLFVCPENLASMSGEMKEMFDRCYYPVLGQVGGRAYATIIAAGSDGEGAQRQIDRIATGWRLKRVADPWIVITHAQSAAEIAAQKSLSATDLARANELGCSMAEAIKLGIY